MEIESKTKILMDAGYFNEKEVFRNKNDEKIEVLVQSKKNAEKKDKVPAAGFEAADFKYDKESDQYFYPESNPLIRTHTIPGKEKSGREVFE